MALIRWDGIHHAKGVLRWKDVERITLSLDDTEQLVAVEVESAGLTELVVPPMHRRDALLRLISQKMPPERVGTAGDEAERRPLYSTNHDAGWIVAAERSVARFYHTLNGSGGIGFLLALMCYLSGLALAGQAGLDMLGIALFGLGWFLHPAGRGYGPVPDARVKRYYRQSDARTGERRTLGYLHTNVGWWLWGQLIVTILPLLLFLSVGRLDQIWMPALSALILLEPYGFWVLLAVTFAAVVGVRDIRFVVIGGDSRIVLTVKSLGLPLWRRVAPYSSIVWIGQVERPPWFMLGMLWITRESVWNLTPHEVVAIETKDGRRYLVATDEPEALCRFVRGKITG